MRESSRSLRSLGVYLLGLALVVAFVVAARATIEEVVRRREVRREIARIQGEADRLEQQRGHLTTLLATSDGQEFLEREARLRLGLRKPGESVIVVRTGEADAARRSSDDAGSVPSSNMRKWWQAIFGHSKSGDLRR